MAERLKERGFCPWVWDLGCTIKDFIQVSLLCSSTITNLCSSSSSGLKALVCHSPHTYTEPSHLWHGSLGMPGHMAEQAREQANILSQRMGRAIGRPRKWLYFNIGISRSQKEQQRRKGDKSPNIKSDFLKIRTICCSSDSLFSNAIPDCPQ